MSNETLAALDLAVANINKQFGENSIIRLGTEDIRPWPAVPTGSLTLDSALGIGGLPLGRIVEIYGPESSGKSTLCLSVVKAAQEQGKVCAYVDSEHALDPGYAKAIGVKVEDLLVSQPSCGEEALEIVNMLTRTGNVGVIVVDSVAGLTPRAEIEGLVSDTQVGLQARMMSKEMRILPSLANNTGTLVVFTNQIREKIGVMFGNPETTPGGRALRFLSSVRIELRRRDKRVDPTTGEINGVKTLAKVVKNKMAPPFKEAEFDIVYGEGIDQFGAILDVCLLKGILTSSGSWIKRDGESFAQGRAKAITLLKENPDLAEELKGLALQ